MGVNIKGLEDLVGIAGMLEGTVSGLNSFVKANMDLVPEEHKDLFKGLETKSLPELEELKKEIERRANKA